MGTRAVGDRLDDVVQQCRACHRDRRPHGETRGAPDDEHDRQHRDQNPKRARCGDVAHILQECDETVMMDGKRVCMVRDALVGTLQPGTVRTHQRQQHSERHEHHKRRDAPQGQLKPEPRIGV